MQAPAPAASNASSRPLAASCQEEPCLSSANWLPLQQLSGNRGGGHGAY